LAWGQRMALPVGVEIEQNRRAVPGELGRNASGPVLIAGEQPGAVPWAPVLRMLYLRGVRW